MSTIGQRRRAVWRRSLLLALAALVLATAGAPIQGLQEDDRPFVGLSLGEALLRLQAKGLPIVFTSEVVRPDMTVEVEPAAVSTRELLDELLAAHDLGVVEGAGGTLIVVAVNPRRESLVLAGQVLSSASGEPLDGALVRVREAALEARSDGAGRFELAGLKSGTYTVEARRDGYVSEHLRRVVVAEESRGDLAIALRPLPFVNEEIVVRPSRLSLLQEQPASPLSLSRREIDALPHIGGEVTRALSLFPGTAANDVSARLSIRGGRRDELQIVLDGQELYDAYHLKDFDSVLTIVPAEELADASLSTGNFPARHGDRMSGVLDLRTQSSEGPLRSRLGASLYSVLGASAGSFDRGRGTWLTSLRRGTTDLAGRLVRSRNPSFWDALGKLGLELDEANSLRAHALIAGDQLAFDNQFNGEVERLGSESSSSYLWLTHQAILGRRTLVETSASSARADRERLGGEVEGEGSIAVSDDRGFDVLGVSQEWSHERGSGHQLSGGFELRRYDATFDYSNEIDRERILTGDLLDPAGSVPRFVGRLEGDHLAGWAADRMVLRRDLTLELGLRYDRIDLTADELVSPRVNLAWRPSETGVVRAGWGIFQQSQRPYELLVEDGDTQLYPAERSAHWVLGYERLFGTSSTAPLEALRLELYRREIDEPRPRYENLFETLGFFPEVEEDRVRVAPERASASGVELLVRGSAGARADWWMSYTFSRAVDRIDGRRVRRFVDQPHSLNLATDWRLSRRWALTLTWRYHSGWPTTPVSLAVEEGADGEAELVPRVGALNRERLPNYHRMDLRASRRWQVGRGQLHLYVDVHNVYDRQNVAGYDYEVDEENAKLLVMEDDWVGILPSAGITWEF